MSAPFPTATLGGWLARLAPPAASPGEPPRRRRPGHVLYGGAQLYTAGSTAKIGALAARFLDEHLPDAATFAEAFELGHDVAEDVRPRVAAKLAQGAVEDRRVDFEDGFGLRSDDDEDREALRAGALLAAERDDGALPPFVGVRVRSLGPDTAARALRTLDRACAALLDGGRGGLPEGFRVTLPKVTRPVEVEILDEALAAIEARHGLARGAVAVELLFETPSMLLAPSGQVAIGAFVAAAQGRCESVHLGAYDLLSSLGVPAAFQRLDHGALRLARQLATLALAGTGVDVVDGATNDLPTPPHRAKAGEELPPGAREENRAIVFAALRAHARGIRGAAAEGIVRGWDLHPAQLVSRWATTFALAREGLPHATRRLRGFLDAATHATRTGSAFDDLATAEGLFVSFARGRASGALDAADLAAAGLGDADLAHPTLARALAARGKSA